MRRVEEQRSYWDSHPIGAEIISEEVGSKAFYERYVPYYDRFYDYKQRAFRYDGYRGRKVLEIGCGLGIDTLKWARGGANLTAVDLSRTSVTNTRKLLSYNGLGAKIIQADAARLPFPDKSFDVVYAYGILMLVDDMQKGIDEVYRVLKDGGEALVVLYHRWSWFWLLVKLSGTNVESEAGDPPLNRVHSRSDIKRLFSRFSTVRITTERPPQKTDRRSGVLAQAYNRIFVPAYSRLPKALIRSLGWHLVVKATR